MNVPKNVMVADGLRVHLCPKVATASISAAMHGVKYHHERNTEAGPEFRFIPVRHPLDRLVSAWWFFCQQDDKEVERQHGLMEIGYRHGMRFAEFMELALVHHDEDQHTRMQVKFAGPHEGFLCPLSALPEAWERLRQTFPALNELKRSHVTNHMDWKTYYTPDLRRKAEEVFSPDMELYKRTISHGKS